MNETEKTNKVRNADFFEKYLSGKIIDIGGGDNLVLSSAERFDLEDGDANDITKYRTANSYDTVYSSHCLEHMRNPVHAICEWWKLVKPSGYMVLVVPDEDLYEQGFWPSRFNEDHKCTFRLSGESSWSPVSYNIVELLKSLPQSQLISVERQDKNYDYNLQLKYPPKKVQIPNVYFRIKYLLNRLPFSYFRCDSLYKKIECKLFGIPIDQTLGNALAQIQVVCKKNN